MSTPTPSCFELSCTECDARTAKLTAERDQLRDEVELDEALQLATESSLKTAIARAEKAEDELARLVRPCCWPHCEPVKADHAELANLRLLLAECFERLEQREHRGALPYSLHTRVLRALANKHVSLYAPPTPYRDAAMKEDAK